MLDPQETLGKLYNKMTLWSEEPDLHHLGEVTSL